MGAIKRDAAIHAHHDLTKFTLGDITQLNLLHGYSLPGCPVERA
jgi:hypothetical protein